MISTSWTFTSTASFLGPKGIVGRRSSGSLGLRPMNVSASYASTVERDGSRIASTSSLYEVLGIGMEATCQEIKTAYRRLARVVHPDVSASGQSERASADEFMKIHEAYSTLSDPDRRADYDRRLFGRQWPASNSRFSMSSSDSGFSGSRRRTWETDQCW